MKAQQHVEEAGSTPAAMAISCSVFERVPLREVLQRATEFEGKSRRSATGTLSERKHRILVVDDERTIADTLALILDSKGYAVAVAYDAQTALRKYEEERPSLVLSDVVMPGMDGVELARVAGERHPEIKVMFITGFAAVAMKTAAVSHGQPRVLSKPVHLKDLIRAVDRLLAD